MENNGEEQKVDLNKLLTTEVINKSNNIDKITDKIYIGDEDGAKEFDFLKNEQIHNVLSLVGNPPTYPEDMKINLMNLNLEDCLNTNIINPIKECADFIDKSDKIFIHCSCGVNRSPAIAIGYLMWKTHASYDEVFNFLDNIHSFNNSSKHNVFTSEPIAFYCSNKELRSVCIWSCISHSKFSRPIEWNFEIFIWESFSVNRSSPSSILSSEISPLNHEFWNDSMKFYSFITETFFTSA